MPAVWDQSGILRDGGGHLSGMPMATSDDPDDGGGVDVPAAGGGAPGGGLYRTGVGQRGGVSTMDRATAQAAGVAGVG